MKIVKGIPPQPKKLKIKELSVGTVFKFAEPWGTDSDNMVFVVFKKPDGTKSSLSLTDSREVMWEGEGHEDNFATILEATLTVI